MLTVSLRGALLIGSRTIHNVEETFHTVLSVSFYRSRYNISISLQVRVNTRLLYQQTKFNLLREESEGYAKLVHTSLLL